MHRDLYNLAQHLKDRHLPDNITELKNIDRKTYGGIIVLSKKYRFEHTISLDQGIDLSTVYRRVKQEVEAVQKGAVFATDKKGTVERTLLPETPELVKWLHLSIWNRILQSNAHQLDARARASVRPVLIEFGSQLAAKGILDASEKIFECSRVEIRRLIEENNN
jgi:hypothetical protein